MAHRWTVRGGALAALALFLATVVPAPAGAQLGPSLLRNQTRTIQRAIEMQVRQAIRPRLTIRSGPIDRIAALRATPDGRWLVTAPSDPSLRLWDLARGGEVLSVPLSTPATAAAVSPDGRLLVARSSDGQAVMIPADDAHPIVRTLPAADVRAVSALDRAAVLGLGDGRLLLASPTGATVSGATLEAPVSALRSLDGGILAAGLENGAVVLLTRRADTLVPSTRWTLPAAVVDLSAGPGGRLHALAADGTVAALAPDGTVRWRHTISGGRAIATIGETRVAVLAGTAVHVLGPDGRETTSVPAQVEAPTALAGVAGGRGGRLLVAGSQGRTTLLAMPEGRALVSLYSTRIGWAAVDDQGRFDGTDRSVRDVAWDLDGRLVDIDRFAARYFEPGLVVSALADGPLLTDPGRALDDGVFPPPEVTLETGAAAAPGQAIAVTVTASVEGRAVQGEDPRLWLFRNGKRVLPETAGTREDGRAGNRTVWTWEASIPALAGDNVFQATVLGWNDIQAPSEPRTVSVVAPPPGPRFLISGVGINDYAGPQLQLNFAVADAEAVTAAFLDTAAGGMSDTDHISVLTLDGEATRETVLAQLSALESSGPQDILTVFLSGHARAIGSDWYFLPAEALSLAHDEHVRQVGISAEELAAALTRVPAERIVLIIDACQSGAAVGTFESFGQRKALNGVAQSTGVTVMAATRADQLAPEYSDLGHGIFTYTLLNGLQRDANGHYNADRWPQDGQVMVGELRRYVETYVPLLAAQLDARYQSQTRGDSLADRAPVTPTSTPVAADFPVR